MNKPLKAALLSAFILPGSGHFYVQNNLKGMLLACAALVCHYFLILSILELAQDISRQINAGEIPLDLSRIREALMEQVDNSGSQSMTLATYCLGAVWIFGIFDSYRIARLQNRRLQKILLRKSNLLMDNE